ncbi:MAG TPA: DHA2 family efflux MFS transporter permease subunit [Stellaceae bacterium]|nr:DHA2 family efflux MFS transporter permease subunit [Stellaceae bacterium]
MSQAPGQDRGWRPRHNPWLVALTVTLVAFMEVLDTTIVNVALPHIAGELSSSQDEATWTLTSYLIANGIVLPISGFLGRLFGRKCYFLVCIGGFTASSFLCGTATSLGELIVFRLLQGFFGGGLQPNQQSIILDTFPPDQRARAFAITAVATVVAPVLGPTLGGWITDNYSWRWIFFINVPIGLFTFFAVLQLVEDPPWAKRGARPNIDFIGLGFIALGFGALQVVLDRGEDADWFASPFIRLFAVLAAIGLVGAVYWLLYARRPIVDLRVLADRNFAVGSLMIFVMALILYSSAVMLPQLTQRQLGYTALWAGLVLSPGALVLGFLIPLVGRFVMPYVQTRLIVAFGLLSLGLAFLYAQNLTPQLDFYTLAKIRMAQTIGLAFLFVPISTAAYLTLPAEQNADAAALYTMFRNVAGSIGIAVSTALVTTRSQVRQAYLTDHLGPLDPGFNDTLHQVEQSLTAMGVAPSQVADTALGWVNQTLINQAAVLAYTDVFLYCAALAFAGVPFAFLFSARRAAGAAAGVD